jgi:DNA polymerase-1
MSARTEPGKPRFAPAADTPGAQLFALRHLLAELQALGVKFEIRGADVVVTGAEALPASLREALQAFMSAGDLLWAYLGGDANDDEAFSLIDALGVEVIHVEWRAGTRVAVRQLIRDLRRHGGPLAIDIETAPLPEYRPEPSFVRLNSDGGLSTLQPVSSDRTALSPHLASIATLQLYAGGTGAYVFTGRARELVLHSHWLRRQWLVAHNATFETGFLHHHTRNYRRPPHRRARGRLECSLQATGCVLGIGFGGSGRSLANASKDLLDLDVPKELRTSDWGAARHSEGQLAYAAVDAALARRLWPRLVQEMRANGTLAAYELQRRAVPAVAAMELRGLTLDRAEHERQIEAWSRELAEGRRQYQEATKQVPPSSPNEVRAWLTTVLDANALASWPRTETGMLSVETGLLKRLVRIESARPVLRILAHEKLLSTFGFALAKHINPATGRLHAHYNIAGSKAGRFTCSNPNLQQLPSQRAPEFRRCIVAAPGNLLVGCDWNQVEVRAAAWLSGDQELTRLYVEGRDLHSENAAVIAGVPLAEVTKPMRQAAKATTFGALYGIGPRSLAEDAFANYGIEMTEAEAKQALDAFFLRFATLARWRHDNAQLCQARGYVSIGVGRRVEATWEPGGHLSFPQCCNLPVQGICADAMLRAIALVHARFNAAGIRGGLVATVHDELLAEVVEADADAARNLLQQAMIDAFAETFPGAPTTNVAAAEIGCSWMETKA